MTLEEMKAKKHEYGYTMAQLSELSGVPVGTLQKIFNGETAHPRYQTRQAIERVLGAADSDPDIPYYQLPEDTMPNQIHEPALQYHARPVKRPGSYTVSDYYALPDDQRVELIDGVIYEMEAPGFVHQQIASAVLFQVSAYIQQKGGPCIPLTAPLDVRLDCDDRTMVQPDFIILCDRNKIKRWGIMGAPDFVLEIISPSTRKKDYTKKLQKYTDAGVREYWIIDPEKKMLITYDFINWDLPCIYPLTGTAAPALYGGELQINLDHIASLIREWPD